MSGPASAPDSSIAPTLTRERERLGDFELERTLGEGGSAIVYAARRGGEHLALKVLRPELSLSEREVAAFVAEAHRAQRVRHASLVEIVDVGVLPDGRPYIAMPLLHGETLAERIARGPMALDEALPLFRGLAEAVSTLHAEGIVHRDIKPENVFVTGGDRRLVLLDLGIARDVSAPASTTTQAGLVRGTPAYMAPERFFGARASELTDTYESAVVLYAMLTGRLPWERAQEALGRMSPRDPRTLVALPEGVAVALLRALSLDEKARPQSMTVFLDDLEHAAISTAPTLLSPVLQGAAPTLASPVAVRGSPGNPARALSAAPPPNDLATQDTVAISTGRFPRRAPAWAPAVFAACVLAGAAAGVWAFLARPAQEGLSSGESLSSVGVAPGASGVSSVGVAPGPSGVSSAGVAPGASGVSSVAVVPSGVSSAPPAPDSSGNEASPTSVPVVAASPSVVASSVPVVQTATLPAKASATPTLAQPTSASASAATSASASASAATSASAPAPAPTLSHCFALLAIYCAPDFKATDGGTTCTAWTSNVQRYQMMPKTAWQGFDDGCNLAQPGALLAISERRRQMAAKKNP